MTFWHNTVLKLLLFFLNLLPVLFHSVRIAVVSSFIYILSGFVQFCWVVCQLFDMFYFLLNLFCLFFL